MGSPTSPSGCAGCSRLEDQVASLQRRISDLYQIRDAEKQMNSLFTFGPTRLNISCDSTPSQPADVAPCPALDVPSSANAPGSIPHCPADDNTAPRPAMDTPLAAASGATALSPAVNAAPSLVPNNSWARREATREVPTSSTPAWDEPWSRVGARDRRRSRYSRALPNHDIQLGNRFDVLDLNEFPPLPDKSRTPSPLQLPMSRSHLSPIPPSAKSRVNQAQRTKVRCPTPYAIPVLRGAPAPLLTQSPPPPPPSHGISPPMSAPPPSTLVIGDSIVRGIKKKSVATFCFPGAKVADITSESPSILADHPLVPEVVVHVGGNDLPIRASEKLKRDYIALLDFFMLHNKRVFVSGLLPPLNRGAERFSRTLWFHTWLKSTCATRNIVFIDNFNLFWNRRAFFRPDGIHPNALGSRIFTDNLFYTIHTSRT